MAIDNLFDYKPVVYDDILYLSPNPYEIIRVNSFEWFDWLDNPDNKSFSYKSELGNFSVRKEFYKSGKLFYWRAYKKINKKLKHINILKDEKITLEKLIEIRTRFKELSNHYNSIEYCVDYLTARRFES